MNQEPETNIENQEPRTKNQETKLQNQEPGTKNQVFRIVCFVLVLGPWFLVPHSLTNEVLNQQEINFPSTHTEVMVKTHPNNKQEYIAIVDPRKPRQDLRSLKGQVYKRPDYRMLQKNVSAKDVGYDGPYSSKKKIYILAATLATAGATAAVVGPALFPAAAATGAAGSAAGPAIAAGVGGSALAAAANKYQEHYKNLPDDYNRESESKIVETETDFYQLHVARKTTKPLQR